jgi:hypothetical protein
MLELPGVDAPQIVAGFLVAFGAGHVLTYLVMGAMPLPADQEGKGPSYNGPLGVVERTIYAGAVVTHHPEFVAVWLALKVAKDIREQAHRRAAFNRWLTGSGLSLIFGVAGGYLASTPPGTDVGEWYWWPSILAGAVAALILFDYRWPGKHWLRL